MRGGVVSRSLELLDRRRPTLSMANRPFSHTSSLSPRVQPPKWAKGYGTPPCAIEAKGQGFQFSPQLFPEIIRNNCPRQTAPRDAIFNHINDLAAIGQSGFWDEKFRLMSPVLIRATLSVGNGARGPAQSARTAGTLCGSPGGEPTSHTPEKLMTKPRDSVVNFSGARACCPRSWQCVI